MEIAKLIFKNSLILYSSEIIAKILNFILIILITRNLGVTTFGEFSFIINFVTLFYIFTDLGIKSLLKRDVSDDESKMERYINNILVLKISLGVLFIAIISILSILFNYEHLIVFFLIFALSEVLLSYCEVFIFAFQAIDKMWLSALSKLIRIGLRLMLILIFLGDLNIITILVIYLISVLLELILDTIIYRVKIRKISFNFDRSLVKSLLLKMLPFGITTFFSMMYFKIDIVILQHLKDSYVVGLYSAAYALFESTQFIPYTLSMAFAPTATRLFKQSINRLTRLVEKLILFLSLIVMPLTIIIFLLSEELISIIYGLPFLNSSIALKILVFAVPPLFFNFTLGSVLIAMHKERTNMFSRLLCAIINIILNILLIPKYSFVGAAITTVISELILFSLSFYFVSLSLKNIEIIKILYRPVIASIIMASVIIFLKVSLLIVLPLAIVVYFISLYLSKAILKEDLLLIKKIMKNENQ